jgi:hypothetical protein
LWRAFNPPPAMSKKRKAGTGLLEVYANSAFSPPR